MKMRYVHACQVCGKVFVNIHGRAQMYCGSPCKHLASRGAVRMEKTCPCCGKVFRTFDGRMRFCSVECRLEDKRRRKEEEAKLMRDGLKEAKEMLKED